MSVIASFVAKIAKVCVSCVFQWHTKNKTKCNVIYALEKDFHSMDLLFSVSHAWPLAKAWFAFQSVINI